MVGLIPFAHLLNSHVRSKQQIPPLYLDPQSLSSLNTGAETQGLVDERLRHLDINNWSSVAVSSTLAANAISLYLTNEHPIEGFFDADLFLDDLIAGRTTYCSRLLVNAILACACVSAPPAASLFRFQSLNLTGRLTLFPAHFRRLAIVCRDRANCNQAQLRILQRSHQALAG